MAGKVTLVALLGACALGLVACGGGARYAQDDVVPDPVAVAGPEIWSGYDLIRHPVFYFAHDSAVLTPENEAMAARLAKVIRHQQPDRVPAILIQGHTDRSGSAGANVDLGLMRAQTVAHALVRHGVDASMITTRTYGEAWNDVPTADGVRSAANRRVYVLFPDR